MPLLPPDYATGTVHSQCCRHRLVGKRVISNVSIVHSCWGICSLCSDSNTNLLLRLFFALCCIWNCLFCFTCQTYLALQVQHGDRAVVRTAPAAFLSCPPIFSLRFYICCWVSEERKKKDVYLITIDREFSDVTAPYVYLYSV